MKKLKRNIALALVLLMLPININASGPDYYQAADGVDAAIYLSSRYADGKNTGYIKVPSGVATDAFVSDVYYYFRMLFADYSTFYWLSYGTDRVTIEVTLDGLESKRVLAEAAAKQAADEIIHSEMSDLEKLTTIHDYVIKICEYDYKAARNAEFAAKEVFSAYGALIDGKAVCDGYSAAVALLCRYAGIPCIYILSSEMNHSWNAVLLDGEVRFIDTTYDDTGAETQSRDYFLLSAEELAAKGHIWDQDFVLSLTDRIWDIRFRAALSLMDIGLFKGSDKGLELERTPYRSEASLMLLRLMGLEQKALEEGASLLCPFDDVSPYYTPYIAYLAEAGLARGTSDSTFSPSAFISAQQYMTFVLRALGYDDAEGDFMWSSALESATIFGILTPQEVEMLVAGSFDRGDMAYISYRALWANLKDGSRLIDHLVSIGYINPILLADFEKSY